MQAAYFRDDNAVARLPEQLVKGKHARLEVQVGGSHPHRRGVVRLAAVARGLHARLLRGLQIVQEGAENAVLHQHVLMRGHALVVKGTAADAVGAQGIVHQRDAGRGNGLAQLAGQEGQAHLLRLGGENGVEYAQQADQRLIPEDHAIFAGGHRLCVQPLHRLLHAVAAQRDGIQRVKVPAELRKAAGGDAVVLLDVGAAVQLAEVLRVGLIHAVAVGDAHGVLRGVDHVVAVQIPSVRGLALVLHGFDLRQLGFGRNLVQLRVVQRHFRELPAALIERLLVLAFA